MTGAWRPGDDPGRRQFASVLSTPLPLELGGALGAVTVAYETWGKCSPRGDNAVLILHALTGDSHAAGPVGNGHVTPGWWDALIGPGAAIDTDRWWVVCPNVLGGCQGTTGPSSAAPDSPDGRPWGSRFPAITVRDQVSVEAALADHLGIERWAAVIGGSMGGMRAVEWPVMFPARVERTVILATGASATAEQIALCALQSAAIRLDPGFRGGDYYDAAPGEGPHRGLGLARRIGHVSYRSEPEMAARFGRSAQPGEDPLSLGGGRSAQPGQDPLSLERGRYAIESYLDHQADKLVRRFDANSYLVLSRAMDHHDVGRGRGGARAALSRVEAAATVIGIGDDRLYPPYLQAELASLLPGSPELHLVDSRSGHDGFLVEWAQVGKLVAEALESRG